MNILWFVDKEFDTALDRTTWIEIIKNLQDNFNIYIATGFKKEKIKIKELENIFYFASLKIPFINRLTFYLNQIIYFNRLIKKYNPNIILFNCNNFFLLKQAVVLRKRYKFKIYLDIRTIPVWSSRYKNLLNLYFLRHSLKVASKYFDGITYITEEMKRYLEEKFNLPKHKIEIWSSGVNTDIFKPLYISRKNNPFRLIYHGDLGKKRKIDNVVKSLAILKEYEIEFFILGSGEALNELNNLVKKLGLTKRVILHAPVSYKKVPEYINRADVGILPLPNWPGWNVSSPIKLFEYLACGKPVIATKISAHINILEGRNFVFWANSASPQDIANAIKEAYMKREYYTNLGNKARKFVIENYTWEKQAQKLGTFFKISS